MLHTLLKISGIVLLLMLAAGSAFYLIPLPPRKLAQLAAEQEAYFFQAEAQWLNEHNLAEVVWAKALEFKLRHDLKDYLSEQLSLNSSKPAASISASANHVRNLFINQTQGEVPVISNSALASFVRGYGYCDQVNGYLALLLSSYLDKVQLFGVRNEKGISPHTLIRSRSALGVVWIDAFSCVNAFGFEEELSSSGRAQIPLYKQRAAGLYPSSYYKNGNSFNEFGLSYTAGKAYARLGELLTIKSANIKASLKPATATVAAKRNTANSDRPSKQTLLLDKLKTESLLSKQLYIKARVFHIAGELQEAALLYEKLIGHSPEGPLAAYAAIFLDRMKGKNIPCH
ncbi:hypothetical protein [Cesiribacter sp. SM1]|uniref:hypothetical protein n=1 Tax=Cesiribacter sp. SM1 TaxID=2861196 RepID=UPI001CD602C4|nr:hypothetical protein [Cesiribacter sp. SM1]